MCISISINNSKTTTLTKIHLHCQWLCCTATFNQPLTMKRLYRLKKIQYSRTEYLYVSTQIWRTQNPQPNLSRFHRQNDLYRYHLLSSYLFRRHYLDPMRLFLRYDPRPNPLYYLSAMRRASQDSRSSRLLHAVRSGTVH